MQSADLNCSLHSEAFPPSMLREQARSIPLTPRTRWIRLGCMGLDGKTSAGPRRGPRTSEPKSVKHCERSSPATHGIHFWKIAAHEQPPRALWRLVDQLQLQSCDGAAWAQRLAAFHGVAAKLAMPIQRCFEHVYYPTYARFDSACTPTLGRQPVPQRSALAGQAIARLDASVCVQRRCQFEGQEPPIRLAFKATKLQPAWA